MALTLNGSGTIQADDITLSGNANVTGTMTSTGALTPDSGIYLGGTVAANLLDDYEEGTWTPVLTEGTNTLTVSSSAGHYIKIGRLVWARFNIGNITKSGTGYLRVSLPFVVDQNAYSGGLQMQRLTYDTNDRSVFLLAIDNLSQVGLYFNTNGNINTAQVIASDIADASAGDILGTITYMTD